LKRTKDELVVEYDYERDDGNVEWSKIVFTEILVLELRDFACCRADDVIGCKEIRSQADSPLLKDAINQWQETVGWQDWQQARGGADRFRHFTIWFDDAASLNVVASACQVELVTPSPA
jgi:hypothetical protein